MANKEFNARMGRVIRELRLKHGFTQEAVGTAISVTFQQVQKYERGANGLAAHYLPALAAFFGVTVADLYELAGVASIANPPSEAESDSFLAARYIARIADPKLRSLFVDFLRKAAYQVGEAV
jgi:transcriptional regulator with XRE-family HTH domain